MIQDAIAALSGFDWFVIVANVFLLVFSNSIARWLSGTVQSSRRGRMSFCLLYTSDAADD